MLDTQTLSRCVTRNALPKPELRPFQTGRSNRRVRAVFLLTDRSTAVLFSDVSSTAFRLRNTQHLRALVDVVGSAKEDVHLLKRHHLGLGNQKVDEDDEQEIDGHEEEEALEARVVKEQREELVEDGLGDVLCLRAHTHGLGTHIHTEDFGGPDPGCGTPGWLVEEDEEEEQEHNGDADGLRLARGARSSETNSADAKHANTHAQGADHEHPATAEAVDGPGSVESEQDTTGGVQGVDQVDSRGGFPHLFVDGAGVGVERALAGELLADVEGKGQVETLANGRVLEQRSVARADGLLLVLQGLADNSEFFFDHGLGLTDAAQGAAGALDVALLLDVPTRCLGHEGKQNNDNDRDEDLEDHNHAPVPLAQILAVQTAGIVDPVGDESAHGIESLPECHDQTTDLWWGHLTDVHRTSSWVNR